MKLYVDNTLKHSLNFEIFTASDVEDQNTA